MACDPKHWYAIHTKLREEERASNNLSTWGVENFAPKIRGPRYNQYTGKPTYVTEAFLPTYIFARFGEEMHQAVRFAGGVRSIVSFGGCPAQVGDEIIQIIRARTVDGFVRLDDEFRAGDEVTIKDGPLRNFTGIFQREMKHDERVMILLTTISYQASVIVQREMLSRAAASRTAR